MQDIFRAYPGRFEGAIGEACAALDTLEEPDAKAALVWIVGEHAERLDNADELLAYLLDTFLDEPVHVQLALLTAAVKLFLKKPAVEGAQALVSSALTAATEQSDNPDLRDRAFLYWRLLSALPEVRDCLGVARWAHAQLLIGVAMGLSSCRRRYHFNVIAEAARLSMVALVCNVLACCIAALQSTFLSAVQQA